jgi:hypothetical protein
MRSLITIVPPALSSGGHAEQLVKTSKRSLRLLLETADMRVDEIQRMVP